MIIFALRYFSYKQREKETAAKATTAEVKVISYPASDQPLPPVAHPASMVVEPIG